MNHVSSPRPRGLAVISLSALVALSLSLHLSTEVEAQSKAKRPRTEEQQVAEAIERALQKHGPDVHRCFEQALADRLDTAGKVEVEVDVGPGGQVTAARLLDVKGEGADLPPALGTCVQAAAKSWKIAGVEAGASVVLPFSFEGQINQFVIKAADVPDRGPAAGKGKAAAKGPFTVKVLVDPENVRHTQASLTLLTVGPASRVAMHRHPRSAKILYVLKGRARVLGPTGTPPMKADEGAAIFLPPGYPHVIENMARQADTVFLQVFSPPGPERVYRDPKNPEARADFEVIRDPRVKAPEGARPIVVSAEQGAALSIAGGKGKARILLDEKATGSNALSLSLLELSPGLELPREQASSSELLYVQAGGGKLTVGSDSMPFGADSALAVPADQPRSGHIGAAPTIAVQIFAPAGPEQRYRQQARK
jgi:quercetin dioxygenase-like cupin family protein